MTIEALLTELTIAVRQQTEATLKNNELIELALAKSGPAPEASKTGRQKKEKPVEPEPETPVTTVAENAVTPVVEATEGLVIDDAVLAEESDLLPVRDLVRTLQKEVGKEVFDPHFIAVRGEFQIEKLHQLRKNQVSAFVAKLEEVRK